MVVIGSILGLAFILANEFLSQLNITQKRAEESVWYSFAGGTYSGPLSKAYHEFAVPVRVAMVREIGAFAKSYTQSEDFKKNYAVYRDERKPSPPEPLMSMADLKKEQQESIQKALSDAQDAAKTATGDIRKAYEEMIKGYKDQLKQLDDPNNPMFSREMEDMMKQSKESENQDYQQRLQAWEKQYPSSPHDLIKARLQYFLELSSTVDFKAQLVPSRNGKTMVFQNKEYESRPSDWKLIYRCGKESTDAARVIATQWLKELK